MSCRRPGLTYCRGDHGFCQCRRFPSRAHLEREILTVEQLLGELRQQLQEEYPEMIVDDETDSGSDDDWQGDETI